MKKIAFILLFFAFAVFSCKNNQNQPAQAPETITEQTADISEVTETSQTPVSHDSVAFKVYTQLVKGSVKRECPEGSTLNFYADLSEAEGYMIDENIYCYPRKDGSYLAVFEHLEAAEGQGGEYDYHFYVYKDGDLSEVENPLPVPELKELLKDPKEYPGQDEVVARLDSLFNSRPRDFIRYVFNTEEGIMYTDLCPLSYGRDVEPDSEGHYNWLEQYWEMKKDCIENVYRWNGEKFVKEQQ